MALNVQLIRESFNAIRPHALEVVDHFYTELFTRHPEARDLFPKKMEKQQKALVASLAHVVEFLEDGAHLTDYLRKMGARHLNYNTEEEHFAWVGESLLTTLEYYFDESWTEELKENWTVAYTFMATEMKVGMQDQSYKVVPVQSRPAEPTLSEIAQKVSQEMFRRALEEEMANPAVQKLIHEKAQELLKRAIEAEAKQLIAETRSRAIAKSA